MREKDKEERLLEEALQDRAIRQPRRFIAALASRPELVKEFSVEGRPLSSERQQRLLETYGRIMARRAGPAISSLFRHYIGRHLADALIVGFVVSFAWLLTRAPSPAAPAPPSSVSARDVPAFHQLVSEDVKTGTGIVNRVTTRPIAGGTAINDAMLTPVALAPGALAGRRVVSVVLKSRAQEATLPQRIALGLSPREPTLMGIIIEDVILLQASSTAQGINAVIAVPEADAIRLVTLLSVSDLHGLSPR